jgi:site-specific recombinase XerD
VLFCLTTGIRAIDVSFLLRLSREVRGHAEFCTLTRAHGIAWRKYLETRGLADSTIHRMFSALSVLFNYLCEHNVIPGNPVDGVKCPTADASEGSTPALGDAQAGRLLDAPSADTP